MTEHLRMNGVYWGLVALCIVGRQDALDREEMIRYVMSCWDEKMGTELERGHWEETII
jgi:geranylgeranyl transferase type-2 subunit beta